MDQLDMFASKERPRARRTDPQTSHAAADSVDTNRCRRIVREIIAIMAPCTDEQIFEKLVRVEIKMSPSGARTRRSELVRQGYVYDTGERSVTKSGRKTIIWGYHSVPISRAS